MCTLYIFLLILTLFMNLHITAISGMEGWERKNWGEMSVMDMILDRREPDIADDVYMGSESNIGAILILAFYIIYVDVAA